jgi:hypothetical protein
MQTLLTVLIVACSAAYVLWALLLPAAVRRRIALALLCWRWPAAVAGRLQAQAKAPSACACCDGCKRRPVLARPPAAQPAHWAHRQKDRRGAQAPCAGAGATFAPRERG